ncbi:MAG: PKD repeat protein, partial [Bacteroidia bacterium]
MKKSITQKIGLLGKPLLILFFAALFWPATASATHCIDTLDFEFTIDNNSRTVKFESIVSSNALALKWDFGDGSTSTDPNVKHKFDSAGYHKVCLTAYGYDSINKTRCSTTVCKRFKIIDCHQLKIDFGITTSDLSAKFEAKSNSKTVVYGWTFGDNSTSRGQAVKHTYSKEGKYKVCLVAKDTVTGCVKRVCKEVKVIDPCTLKVDFEWKADGLSIKAKGKSNSRHAVYGWTFGDGNSDRGDETKHTYAKAGKYTICFIAKDTVSGCVARKCIDIKVEKPCTLKVAFEYSQDGNDFKFKAKSNDTTTRYVWSFGDGETATGQHTKHAYKKPGTYEVCVTAYVGNSTSTNSGCRAKVCKKVVVKGRDCKLEADFKYETDGKKIRVKGTANESGVLYFWSWGDGTSSTGQTAKHKYDKEGVYEVCLIAFNPKTKCKVCVCKRVKIEKPCKLRAKFKYTISGKKVKFKATSNSKNVVYGWSYGDGDYQRGNPVRHEYQKAGVYKVTLTAKDTVTGCVVTVVNRLIINPNARKRTTAIIPGVGQTQSSSSAQTLDIQDMKVPATDWSAVAYPVPATSQVVFSADINLTSVKVFTTGGMEVLSIDLTSNKNLDITTLPTGYYFAQLTAADGSVKIVK